MPDVLLNLLDTSVNTPALLVLAVVVSTFMLEDLAIIGAAMLAVSERISPEVAFTAVCTGMLIGDTALYLLGRLANTWPKLGRWIDHPMIVRHTEPLQQAPWTQLALIRCMPGIRTFGYIACGVARVPGLQFTMANVISILIWAGVLFGTAFMLGQRFAEDMQAYMWWAMPVALVLFVLGQRRIRQSMEEGAELDEGAQRLSRS